MGQNLLLALIIVLVLVAVVAIVFIAFIIVKNTTSSSSSKQNKISNTGKSNLSTGYSGSSTSGSSTSSTSSTNTSSTTSLSGSTQNTTSSIPTTTQNTTSSTMPTTSSKGTCQAEWDTYNKAISEQQNACPPYKVMKNDSCIYVCSPSGPYLLNADGTQCNEMDLKPYQQIDQAKNMVVCNPAYSDVVQVGDNCIKKTFPAIVPYDHSIDRNIYFPMSGNNFSVPNGMPQETCSAIGGSPLPFKLSGWALTEYPACVLTLNPNADITNPTNMWLAEHSDDPAKQCGGKKVIMNKIPDTQANVANGKVYDLCQGEIVPNVSVVPYDMLFNASTVADAYGLDPNYDSSIKATMKSWRDDYCQSRVGGQPVPWQQPNPAPKDQLTLNNYFCKMSLLPYQPAKPVVKSSTSTPDIYRRTTLIPPTKPVCQL